MAWINLREKILSSVLAPGTPISAKEQAEQLGMSTMPVREALKRLTAEGLVTQQAQRGAFVTPISLERMEDIYRTRIVLERLAVQLACQLITEADFKILSVILDNFEKAYKEEEQKEGRYFHRQFHLELYRIGGSGVLNRLIPTLLDDSERYRVFSSQTRGTPEERRLEHQNILDACFRRDSEKASQLLTEHLERTVQLVRLSLN